MEVPKGTVDSDFVNLKVILILMGPQHFNLCLDTSAVSGVSCGETKAGISAVALTLLSMMCYLAGYWNK